MKDKVLTIIVLSHNRPEYLKQCLSSIILQDYLNFKLVVSENSTNDSAYSLIQETFPGIEVRRRQPTLPFVDHYHKVLSELDTNYTMLFHDDDFLIRPDAISEMMSCFKDGVVAVAGNAFHQYEDTPTPKKFFESKTSIREFSSSKEMFTLDLRGELAPYPSYIYRTEDLKKVKSDWVKYGKYNDGYIMSSLAERGKVVWVANPIMNYRIHANNDSQKMDIKALMNLIQYGKELGVKDKETALYFFPTMLLIAMKEKSLMAFFKALSCFIKHPVHISFYLMKRFLRRFKSFSGVLTRIKNQK